ncbi:MAG: hypothetical protein U5M23_12390 [Marinagarivorans sp.]|nr:hypothetical protein [Marinagarivorans sp.]
MLNLHRMIKTAVTNPWRIVMMASATIALSACDAKPQPQVISVNSSVAVISSIAVAQSSVPVSLSSASVIASSVPMMSSAMQSSSRAAVSSSSVASSSSSAALAQDRPYTIEKIGCNDPDDYSGDATVIFNGSGAFNGSFTNKNFNSSEYQNLSRAGSSSDYTLTQNAVNDASCSNRKVHTGTWLKKLANWSSQHSNSMKASVNRKIGDIDSIVLELRINSALTDVPTKAEIAALYGSKLNQKGLDRLDAGKVAFALTLNDPDGSTGVRGEVFMEIDQGLYADQWIRITIPKNKLVFWTGENWIKTPVGLAAANTATVDNIYMNPETLGNDGPVNYGNVVRNILNVGADADWAALNITEDFKEMNISIRNFEIRYEPTNGNVQASSSAASSSSSGTTSSVPTGNGNVIVSANFDNLAVNTIPAGWGTFIGYQANANNNSRNGNEFILTDSTRARSGANSLYVKAGGNPAEIVYKLPTNLNRIYTRMWVYMDQSMGADATDNHEHFTGLKADLGGDRPFSADKEIRIGTGKGHLGFNIVPDSDAISPEYSKWYKGPTTPKNTWYCVEVGYHADTAYNETYFWVNGVLVNSVTKAADWHAPVGANYLKDKMGYVMFGWQSFSQTNVNMWLDDIVVATDRIGCN